MSGTPACSAARRWWLAALALVLCAVPAALAAANNNFPYATGDVFYVAYSQAYTDPNGINNLPPGPEYVVNLGPYTKFVNANARVNLPDVSAADFNAVLGATGKNIWIGFFGIERPASRDGIISANGPRNDFDLNNSSFIGASQQLDVYGQGIVLYNNKVVPGGNVNAAAFTGNVTGSYQATLNGDVNNPGRLGGNISYNVETVFSDINGLRPAAAKKIRFYVGENNPFTGLKKRQLIGFFQLNTDGTVFFEPDSDGDFVPNYSDNCVNVANADQANADGDAFGAACDCNDANANVWAVPSSVTLSFGADKQTFSWTAPAVIGGTSVVYDTFRQGDPLTGATVYSCFQGNLAVLGTTDAARPAAGHAFHYLAAGENACGRNLDDPNNGQTGSRIGASCP